LDSVVTYQLDGETGGLKPVAGPSARVERGSGPRHLAFSPDGRHAYLVNELASTVIAFVYDDSIGQLRAAQQLSTLPADFRDTSSIAAVRMAPSGRFVYVSNRGHNSIAIFARDLDDGQLDYVGHELSQGSTPRDFNIDPTGTILLAANEETDSIVSFRIDQLTGRLTACGPAVAIDAPACIEFAQGS
jgi:6-phosphogluconolactonase